MALYWTPSCSEATTRLDTTSFADGRTFMIKDPADRTAEAQADSDGAAKRRFDRSFVVGVDIGGTCTDTVVLT